MDKINFDIHKKRYYIGYKEEKKYLCCGDNIRYKSKKDDNEITGTIQYSHLVTRGYYVALNQGKNYLPLYQIEYIL